MRTTFAALASAPEPLPAPAPARGTDVFDFLHRPQDDLVPEDHVTVAEGENPGLVVVTYTTPDGRSLHRNVPAESWKDETYRGGLIRNLALLVA